MGILDDDTVSRKKIATLVNKAAVRRFLLEHAQHTRAHKFKRVAPSVYVQLEACVRERCRTIVHAQPSVGMTIK